MKGKDRQWCEHSGSVRSKQVLVEDLDIFIGGDQDGEKQQNVRRDQDEF